jgi:hypothetical protein
MKSNQQNPVHEILDSMIQEFLLWLEKNGNESYDPYDIWGGPYSLFARKIYYKNSLLGIPLILPILAIDTLAPSLRKLFVKKERYATADAQLLLAFLNLYEAYKDNKYLAKAELLADELLGYSIPGYSGYCWGYPFDWQHNAAFWPRNTPYITCTPYCFEAYLKLYDITQQPKYFNIAQSIAEFVFHDLNDTLVSDISSAASYSPIDNSKVINASAYRAMVLVEAAHRTKNQAFHEKAHKNLNFILESQNKDGSWLYEIDNPKGAFIDHFHTCFVLKNLYKINLRLNDDAVKSAIRTGYDYYRKNLFDQDNIPRSFAKKPRIQIVKIDLYNFAEAITLGSLLKQHIPESMELALKLAGNINRNYRTTQGHFVTKIFIGNFKQALPYLRWSQTQLFYSLTNLLCNKYAY